MSRRFSSASMRSCVSIALGLLLAMPNMVPAASVQEQAPTKLNIVIVEGEGAINNVRQRTAREPIVQVEDENHRPVAGALVIFTLPEKGPSGVFPNGSRSLQVMTNNKGQAVAKGIRVNNVSGKFQIQVEASYKGVSATEVINQANAVLTAAAAAGGGAGKIVSILAVIGAATAGVVVGTQSQSEPHRPPTVVTPGKPRVGQP